MPASNIDFEGATLGTLPSGFVAIDDAPFIVQTAGASSGKGLGEAVPNDGDLLLYTGRGVDLLQDVFSVHGVGTHANLSHILRSSADGAAFRLCAYNPLTGASVIYAVPGYSVIATGFTAGPTFAPGEFMRMRSQYLADGTIRFRVWRTSESEPSTWLASAVDSSPLAAGYAGWRVAWDGTSGTAISIDEVTIDGDGTGPTPTQSITSVTIDQDEADYQNITTQTPIQFTATVVSVGGASTAKTWSRSGAGTITTGGLFTPAARSSSNQDTVITVTSDFDNTKADTITVRVPALPAQAATSYTLTGADTGTVGVAQTLTVTPVGGGYAGAISLPGCSPSSLTFSNESGAKTVTYTPISAGVKTISATANPALGTNRTLEITVTAAPVTTSVTLYSPSFATGLVGTLGVKVISAADVVKVALLTTGIIEQTNAPGNYVASRDYDDAAGDLIQWFDGTTLLAEYRYTPTSSGGSTSPTLTDVIYEVIYEGDSTIQAFTSPAMRFRVTGKSTAGGYVELGDNVLEIALMQSRDIPESDIIWYEATEDTVPSGLSLLLKPSDLSAGSYFIAWRIVNGPQTDGGFIPGLLTIL